MKQIARLTTFWRIQRRRRQSCSDWQGWTPPTFPIVIQMEVEVAYHPLPLAWPFPTPPQGWPGPTLPTTNTPIFASGDDDNEDAEGSDRLGDSDEIRLLSEEEANQFREPVVVDPTVKDDSSWQPPEIMRKYLEANFDRNLSEEERKNILSDFPVPQCSVLKAPTLDPGVKDQIRKKEEPAVWNRTLPVQPTRGIA